MKKLSEINERLWTTAINRGIEGRVKKEDIRELDPDWYKNIKLEGIPKYKASELKSYDIINSIVQGVEEITGDDTIGEISIAFTDENWWIEIRHNTSYNLSRYFFTVHGRTSPYSLKFSELIMDERMSIKYRLDNKKLYLYKYNTPHDYLLIDEKTRNGQVGELFKMI